MCVTDPQPVAHVLRTSSAVMEGRASLAIGCVTPSRTAVMELMSLPPAVSSHLMMQVFQQTVALP